MLMNAPQAMRARREPFVVMAKPVGSACNLGCTYCYYLQVQTGDAEGRCMSDELLETYIRQYIEGNPGPTIQFTWHGGEPTLAGISFFQRAIALQKRYLPPGWTCWNNLQTNGLLLDDVWCAFLAANRFDIGISIDGNQSVHDAHRQDLGGHGTYAKVVAAIERLKKHGLRPDLLCTVTAQAAKEPLAVYRSLKRFNTGWVQFIPIVVPTGEGVSVSSVRAEDYGRFLCDIFDDWILNDLGRLDVQLFAETAMVLAGGQASLCWMSPTCGRVLILERDGGVYACDHFVDAEHRLGSIRTESLAELVEQPDQQRFGTAKSAALPEQCVACRWLNLCHGGCPKDRLTDNLNYLCRGLRAFFAHSEQSLRKLMEMRQRKYTPQRMQDVFRQEYRDYWRGIGPNDPCPCGSGENARQCCWYKRPNVAIEK